MTRPRRFESIVPALLASALCGGVVSAEERPLVDVSDGDRWETVNDGVMGGRSRGGFEATQSGTVLFRGAISLENNGGFSSIRTRRSALDLEGSDGLSLRVKGDGRAYRVSLRTAGTPRMVAYWADLEIPAPGAWTEIRIPFDSFVPTAFGRRLPGPALDVARVNSVGFMLYDKKAGPFALEIERISAYGANSEPSGTTVVDVARQAGKFSTLLAAAKAAGLAETLAGPGPFTVFAPTDAAFEALPQGTVESLLEPRNIERLRTVLSHHVVAGTFSAKAVLGMRQVTTLANQRLDVGLRGSAVRVGEGTVLTADVSCSNGVIHVVDRVLVPELGSLVDVAREAGTFETLLAAAEAAGLVGALTESGPLTLFAPSDEAFAALPAGTVEGLLEPGQRQVLVRLLKHHVVSGAVSLAQAVGADSVKTLAETELTLSYSGGVMRVGAAEVLSADVPARNGVVHVIDRVLLPPQGAVSAPGQGSTFASRVEEARRLIELAIDRGVPLFNDGHAGACQAVYEMAASSLLSLEHVFSPAVVDRLRDALAQVARARSRSENAWTLRRALDAAYAELSGGKG